MNELVEKIKHNFHKLEDEIEYLQDEVLSLKVEVEELKDENDCLNGEIESLKSERTEQSEEYFLGYPIFDKVEAI